jgi:hypothetical protein
MNAKSYATSKTLSPSCMGIMQAGPKCEMACRITITGPNLMKCANQMEPNSILSEKRAKITR